MKRFLSIIPFLFVATTGRVTAQLSSFRSSEPFKTQYILGLNFVPEWQQCKHSVYLGDYSHGGQGFYPNTGLSFEARITRHSGIETGFYYRKNTAGEVQYNAGSEVNRVVPARYRRYFSIPLLYRYYSKIVNVGVGLNYDILFDQSFPNSWDGGKNRLGLLLKVSKDITLYKGLFLEPEFHYNPFWDKNDRDPWGHYWIGMALGLKYRF